MISLWFAVGAVLVPGGAAESAMMRGQQGGGADQTLLAREVESDGQIAPPLPHIPGQPKAMGPTGAADDESDGQIAHIPKAMGPTSTGTPADGTPADGTPADGTPADGTPTGTSAHTNVPSAHHNPLDPDHFGYDNGAERQFEPYGDVLPVDATTCPDANTVSSVCANKKKNGKPGLLSDVTDLHACFQAAQENDADWEGEEGTAQIVTSEADINYKTKATTSGNPPKGCLRINGVILWNEDGAHCMTTPHNAMYEFMCKKETTPSATR